MMEFYPQIKAVHVGCVQLSVLLFVLRGGLMLAGREHVARSLALRATSWSIDTVLLSAALLLLTILPGAMFANHWLTLKLVLLVAYVGCGHAALGRGLRRPVRLAWLAAAVAVIAAMYGIARAHHPLGWLVFVGCRRCAGPAQRRAGPGFRRVMRPPAMPAGLLPGAARAGRDPAIYCIAA